MRIAHIITRLILGGAQENTLITCRELAKRGHDVTLITGPALGPEGDLYEKTRNAEFETVILNELVRPINPVKDMVTYFEMRRLLKKIKPDIIHTHSAKAGIIGRYVGDSLLGKFGHENTPATVHTIHGHSFHPYQSELLNRMYVAIERRTAKKTDAFISVADKMTEEALENKIGTADRFTTAYSAIDMEEYVRGYSEQEVKDFRRKYGISEQATVLVTVARLAPYKGHEFIINAAKQLMSKNENCVWLLIGDGELIDQIKDQIKLNSLRYNFIFTGLLRPEQIPLALHSSDILVHASLREGLARVLPQAMLCSKPVVTFDIGGAAEVVNSDTGRLIEPKDIAGLVSACQELIGNPELRRELGENGKNSVVEKFSPKAMVDTIEKVYHKLLRD